ncbi:hypothetical protein RO3G_07420 [Lichtheimia corymbifera JMRC:FSU:9682]|uniref:Arrestin C-terminal-like domain-containing protein n=1 Tax=Lichtheimia corymbifera JMRC:FSU:9682 TaxID=1263082 RepID=A0A068RSY9_9FUNG|nr:hypothetical protein RO3G_07420 [Lichtheimia corymbifera JMRC:FSU:9682]
MKLKSGKTLDIALNEEKFYFPGERLQGNVIVHPKNPTKTSYIMLKFIGEVLLTVKDKETIVLFQETKQLRLSGDDKTFVLEAKPYTFPFEFEVPQNVDLTSSMEFAKKARVRYTLTAIHHRPMVPETFCNKAEYVVPILEYLDIEEAQFKASQEKSVSVSKSLNKLCHLRVTTPHIGYARGSIVHVGATLNFVEPLVVTKGLKVSLVRIADIRHGRHRYTKEEVLRSVVHDINIYGPFNFTQAISCQLPIPTSTPPTIGFRGTTLRMYYQVRVRAKLNEEKKAEVNLPIVVGTWPRADIPIDDDDDDESITYMSDTHSEPTSESFRLSLNGNYRASFASSATHIRPPATTTNHPNQSVDRSDSNASSRRSYASSIQSWDSLSRNTSLSMPDTPQSRNDPSEQLLHIRRSSRTPYDHATASFLPTSPVAQQPPPPPAPANKHVPILQPILSGGLDDIIDSSSSDDDDDDGDLLRILQKKRRSAQRMQRKQMMHHGM